MQRQISDISSRGAISMQSMPPSSFSYSWDYISWFETLGTLFPTLHNSTVKRKAHIRKAKGAMAQLQKRIVFVVWGQACIYTFGLSLN